MFIIDNSVIDNSVIDNSVIDNAMSYVYRKCVNENVRFYAYFLNGQ